MRRGGLALLIALAVASAPVALEVCRIACESTRHPPLAHATHHPGCHESGTASPHLSAHAHPCEHGDEPTTPGVAAARHSDNAATLLAVAVPAHDALTVVVRMSALTTAGLSSLPGRAGIALATPLRI